VDKPADPATPFDEVYQSFLDDLALEGRKPSTIHRYRYNVVRFEKWLLANGQPAILASLERTVLFTYRQYRETLPQQPRGSHRRRRGGLMSQHTVHSYLRSIKCLASWLVGAGYLGANPFFAVNPYYKKKGVMPVLRADDRIPKIGKPSDVAILLAGCVGDRPEDLRDRAIVCLLHTSGVPCLCACPKDGDDAPDDAHRRSAPAAKPWMKLRRNSTKRISGGRIAIAMPANVSPWSVA